MADDDTGVTEVPDQAPPGMTPFTTSTTNPDGTTRTVTGYGVRRPLAPPASMTGGMPVPDLGPAYAAAFRNLPVDQASKAVEAAMRYQGQRGYMRDLQNGVSAAAAFAKWGPMMFHQATGIPEAIDRSVPTPITPYQQAQIGLRKQQLAQQLQISQAAQQAKIDAINAKPKKAASITVPLDPSNPDGAKISGPADDPDIQEAVKKHKEASTPKPPPEEKSLLQKAKDFVGIKPSAAAKAIPTITSKEQYDALDSGEVYRGKDGRHYRKP